jgi:hypothetical protein
VCCVSDQTVLGGLLAADATVEEMFTARAYALVHGVERTITGHRLTVV